MTRRLACARRPAWLRCVFAATGVLVAQTRPPQPGDPLPGITPVEFEEFRLGLDDFLEVETAEEGLGPGVQRHELRRLPQRAGRSAAPAPIAELRAGRRDADGEFETLDAAGDTLFHLFSVPGHGCQPVMPGRRQRHRAPRADSAVRRRPRRGHPRRDAARARRSRRSQRRRRQRPRRASSSTSAPASAASAGSAGRRSTPRCSRSAPTPIATRWGSPTTCSRTRSPFGIDADADAASAIRFPDPEDIRDPRTRRRGIDNFASFMRFLAPVGARRRSTTRRATGERVFAAIGCAACHVPALDDRPERQSALRPAGRCRCSPICCCTTSAPATASARRRPSRRDPDAGAVGPAAPPAAAARRLGGDDRRRDPAPRRRSGPRPRRLRAARRRRARRAARFLDTL